MSLNYIYDIEKFDPSSGCWREPLVQSDQLLKTSEFRNFLYPQQLSVLYTRRVSFLKRCQQSLLHDVTQDRLLSNKLLDQNK